MHDTVIRGGTIVDGTGKPAFTGDVAIDGDRIVAGRRQGRSRQARDRRRRQAGDAGLGRCPHPLRRPGDMGQGAGAIILARRHHDPVRQLRRRLRPGAPRASRVADRPDGGGGGNPGITLAEGLKWDWESFPQYLDALDRMPRAIDVAAQVPHHPLRVYVMGERAINREKATAEDIEAMRRLTARGAARRARSASPPRAPTRTRRRPARWCRAATPRWRSCSASVRR